jgi:hypothetical protein
VTGTAEVDDRFGEKVTAINTAPRAVSSAVTLRLAVGFPGEDIDMVTKAGAVETFPLLGTAGDSEVWIEAGNAVGLPGTLGTDSRPLIALATRSRGAGHAPGQPTAAIMARACYGARPQRSPSPGKEVPVETECARGRLSSRGAQEKSAAVLPSGCPGGHSTNSIR